MNPISQPSPVSAHPSAATANPALDTILRIVPQLTFEQLRRLSAARRPLDDDAFDAALERAEESGPGVTDEAAVLLQAAWDDSETRFDGWQDARRSAPLDTTTGGHRVTLARVGSLFLLVVSPVLLVAALASAVPWFAPLLVAAGSLAVVVAAMWPQIMQVEAEIDDRGLVLDEAWDGINGAIQALLSPDVDQADYDLLTGPWSVAILPLPVWSAPDAPLAAAA